MRLKALQGLDREKLEAEHKELLERIAYFERVLSDPELVKSILKDELIAIRDKYGDERRTEIQDVEDEIDIEDLIEEETCCFTISNQGYIKRMTVDTYRTQSRGGRGVNAQNLKEEDYVKTLNVASTHDHILFFTDLGRVHHRKGYQIPEAGRTARGTAMVNVLPLEPGETVTAMVVTREFHEDEYLVMCTRKGTVKRIPFIALKTNRKGGIRAITLDENDHLINVIRTNGNDNIILATREGMAICFSEQDVRCMGREAAGVRGIMLTGEDYVVGAEKAEEGKTLLTVTERGFGKRTELTEYLRGSAEGERTPQSRGGKGLKNYNITSKTGCVAGCRVVSEEDDVMLIESGGVIIRVPASDINVYKRDVQGVIIMRIEEGNTLVSMERIEAVEEEETAP
jgi:DNA gyrase subunit A